MDRDTYWATETDEDTLASNVAEVFKRYRGDLDSSPRGKRAAQATLRYFGFDPKQDGEATSSDLIEGGLEGERLIAQVNHFRSLVRAFKSLATSSRPAFDAVAKDESADAMVSCELAEQVWDHELEMGLEHHTNRGAEFMLVQGECAIAVLWDTLAGKIVASNPIYEKDADGNTVTQSAPQIDPQTGVPAIDPMGQPIMIDQPVQARDEDGNPRETPIHEGKLVYLALGPFDVARDPRHVDLRTLPWVIIRRPLHKWDLIAQYGDDDETIQAILGAESSSSTDETSSGAPDDSSGAVSDQVFVLELYHDRTHAVPEGRFVRVCGSKVLVQAPLPYEVMPVVVRSPAQEFARAAGYADSWDLMGLAKAIDGAVSDFISLMDRHGDTPAIVPKGADIDASDLTGPGMVEVQWQQGMPMPQWMKPPEIPDSFMGFLEWLEKTSQTLYGINSVVRGDPEASLKSGAALALVSAQAVQYAAPFQSEFADLLRTVATLVIYAYRRFADTDRMIEVSGNQRASVRSFQGSELNQVLRIRADLANPLMRTLPGRVEVGKDLRDGFPNEPPMLRSQWLMFLSTGRYEPIGRADKSQMENVMFENDRLVKGEPVILRGGDHHELHIREHNALLDGKARYDLDDATVQAIEEHKLAHGIMWMQLTQTNPALLAATNQRPAPMPAMMAPGMPGAPTGDPNAPPPGPGGPPDGGPPPKNGGAPQGPPVQVNQPAIPGTGPQRADMPRPPTNPATGRPAQLPGGEMR